MSWTFFTATGQIKGQGQQGLQGSQGLPVYMDMEGPEGPEVVFPIKGDKGDKGDLGPRGPLPNDPEEPNEPLMVPGNPPPFGSSIGNTTPLAAGAGGVSSNTARDDHTHRSPGGIAAITAEFTKTNDVTETVVVSASLPANFMAAGTTFRVRAGGTIQTQNVSGGTVTWRVRIGTTTLTGNIATSLVPASAAGIGPLPFDIEFLVTVRTAGAGGTVIGNGYAIGNIAAAGAFLYTGTATTATVAVDTTAVKLIELTETWSAAAANNSLKVENASIEVVKM